MKLSLYFRHSSGGGNPEVLLVTLDPRLRGDDILKSFNIPLLSAGYVCAVWN